MLIIRARCGVAVVAGCYSARSGQRGERQTAQQNSSRHWEAAKNNRPWTWQFMCESNHKGEMKTRAMWKSAAPACLSRRYRCCAWFFVVRIDTSIPANTHLHAPIRYVLRSKSCLIGEVSLAINKRCAALSVSSSCVVSADCCEFFLALLIRWR